MLYGGMVYKEVWSMLYKKDQEWQIVKTDIKCIHLHLGKKKDHEELCTIIIWSDSYQ